ncbi:MAG: hypothetical protein U0930_21610 [Pirellulales bacterium]
MFRFFMYGLVALCCSQALLADELLQNLGKSAKDPKQAGSMVQNLLKRKDLALTAVLSAMKGQNDVSKNYYLSVAQSLADREPTKSVDECKQFLTQLDQDPTARFWAFQYVTTYLPTMRERMLGGMLDDPCPELRFEAIESQLENIRRSSKPPSSHEDDYRRLLDTARLPEQIQRIAKLLEGSEKKVDLLKLFGFISQWQVVGTFDNVGQAGFNVVYAPEKQYLDGKLTLANLASQKYDGKEQGLTWKAIETDKPDGKVDLNAPYANAKGAIVYALGNFDSGKNLPAEIRVGSTNAIKVWFNGKLVVDRETYHAGDQIDQYIAPIDLKAGSNSILVKVCQNEQTEQWAQDWFFQLRIADSTGLAIRPSVAAK